MLASFFSRAGQLTPEEFVVCGDALIAASSVWVWRGATPSHLSNSALPRDRQYIFAQGLTIGTGREVGDEGEGGRADDGYSMIDAGGVGGGGGGPGGEGPGGGGGGGPPPGGAGAAAEQGHAPPAGEVDVSITYDVWWRVPHAYFSSRTLSPSQVLALASADMTTTTATLCKHPHSEALPAVVSLHPCKVASVLQTFPDKSQSLIVFLKIVQHALPGLALDATWGV
jgi:hypothetical protein